MVTMSPLPPVIAAELMIRPFAQVARPEGPQNAQLTNAGRSAHIEENAVSMSTASSDTALLSPAMAPHREKTFV